MDGVNLAPAVGLAILMKLEGCSLVSAFDMMRAGRPSIRTKYIGVVAAFEQECRGVCSVPALLNGPIADSKSFCELYNNIKMITKLYSFHDIAPVMCYSHGYSEAATGFGMECPRDRQSNCAVVGALHSEGKAGQSTQFLSWVWSYKTGMVTETFSSG